MTASEVLAGMAASDQAAGVAYAQRALELSTEALTHVRCLRDLPYGEHPRQRLDVYLPKAPVRGPLPVLVFVHGGRWVLGQKEWMAYMAPAVTALPAILVAPTHRLAPEFRLPAPAEDVASAIAWVYRNIAEHGGDPAQIYLAGHSSGAHLAALVALCPDYRAALKLPPMVLKGCFPLSGTYDLDFPDPQPGSEAAAIIDTVLPSRADAQRFSPIHYARGNTTPLFLTYGSQDFGRVMDSSTRMAEILRQQPGRFALYVCDGLEHFEVALCARHADSEWLLTVRDWMTQTAAANWMPA